MKTPSPLSEFDIIQEFFSDIGCGDDSLNGLVSLGVGDDCALLSVPSGQRLAISIDTLLANRHFPIDAAPFFIAQRALAVAISDLAAMGARPLAFTLALSIPEPDQLWLQEFSRGLRASADHYQILLIGGDTTKGSLAITVQVHGLVPETLSLQRSGAQPGDIVFVSGCLGDAAAALDMLYDKLRVNAEQKAFLKARFYQPQARLILGQALLGVATAAIDISDGLLADLGHITAASSVAATVDCARLPLSKVLTAVVDADQALCYALTGGDDYELCFTAQAQYKEQLIASADVLGVPITAIGEVTSGSGVRCIDAEGNDLQLTTQGYQHF